VTRDTVRGVTNKLTRCPFCGALNPVDADWCGQCLARFTEPGVEYGTVDSDEKVSTEEDEEEDEGEPPPATSKAGTDSVSEVEDSALGGAVRGAFQVTDEGIRWVCPRCETVNSIDADVCVACGTRFADALRPPSERPSRDPGTAALLSLFLPGAGHAYLGLWGQAAARAILSAWALLVVIFSVTAGTGGVAAFLAALFGLATIALWAIAAHDAYREASSDEQLVLLRGRRFMWVVAGLLMSLVVALTFAGVSANP
jgi:ribosomal protein L40E